MDMTMSSATPNRVEVVTSVQRRRRWTPEQKLEIVKQTNEPGNSVSTLMASSNSPTRGHPKFPQAARSDYDASAWMAKRAAASLSL